MRTSFDSWGGIVPAIDQGIGPAYQHVALVARYLPQILAVADNLDQLPEPTPPVDLTDYVDATLANAVALTQLQVLFLQHGWS